MSKDKEPSSTTSSVLGKLLAENARDRRLRYKAYKEAGQLNQVAVWPSTDQQQHQHQKTTAAINDVASRSGATAGPGPSTMAKHEASTHQERTAHLLLRVLGLCFVVPLMRLDDNGTPPPAERHGMSVQEALDTMQSMITAQPGTLDDVFQSGPGQPSSSAKGAFVSTTLDLWICPRMLIAASVLTLRVAGVLPLHIGQSSPSRELREETDRLRSSMVAQIKSVLRCSLNKLKHIETVRTLLWEMLAASLQALAQADDAVPKTLPFRRTFAKDKGPQPLPGTLATFFCQGLPEGCHLSPLKTGKRAPGEGIARLWMPEDHTDFAVDVSSHQDDPNVLHCLAQAILITSTGIIFELAPDFGDMLADICQAASKAFLENCQHEESLQQSELPSRLAPPGLQAQRLATLDQLLRTEGKLHGYQPAQALIALFASASHHLQATQSLEVSPADDLESSSRITDALHAVRSSTSGSMATSAWSALRRLAGILLLELSRELHNGQSLDREEAEAISAASCSSFDVAIARKRCAFEALMLLLISSPVPCPLTWTQELGLMPLVCGQGFNPRLGRSGDEDLEESISHPWLSPADVLDARRLFRRLSRQTDQATLDPKKRKRRESDVSPGRAMTVEEYLQGLAYSLPSHDDLLALPTVTTDRLTAVGGLICASAGTLQSQPDGRCCAVCDKSDFKFVDSETGPLKAHLQAMFRHTVRLLTSEAMDIERRLALLGLLRHQLGHLDVEHLLGPANSAGVVRVIRAGLMYTKDREVRLACSRMCFTLVARHVALNLEEGPLLQTRLAPIFDALQGLLTSGNAKVKESTILTLGSLGKIQREEVLEPVLLHLVLQLNSSILLQSCAYLQLTQLATHHKCSTYALLAPYFATISPPIVERMTSAPTLFLEVLKLTNQNQAKFLQATLTFTLPSVVASDNTKALDLMASALGTTVPKLALEQAPAVLKQYLSFPPAKRDQSIKLYLETIRRASGQEVPLRGLYRSYVGEILGHLVSCLGDPDRRQSALNGLRHIESTLSADRDAGKGGRGGPKSSMSSGGDLSSFLRDEILGILAWLNDDLMGVNGRKTPAHKKMCVRSISVLIELVGSSISVVAPQIMATLSSTLQASELRLPTLQSWQAFMTTLRFDEVGPLIGQTAAALLSEWQNFTTAEHKVARSILNYLIVENAQEMRKYITEIPNMNDLASDLPEVCRKLESSRRQWSPEQQLSQILERVSDENASISLRSLHELRRYLLSNQTYLQQQTSGTSFPPVIGRMISALLNTARRSDNIQTELQDLCLECLGIVGAVDPDRLDLPNDDTVHTLLQNFEDQEETRDFAVAFVRDVLVRAFRATSDTKHQSALAYAIQELLRFCGFTTALLRQSGTKTTPVKVRQRWIDLPPAVIDTIAPLLDSKYSITHGPVTEHPRPFYRNSSSYREWIENWAMHLIRGARGRDAETIFGIFRVLIRHHDLELTQHILPHAVLHNLISGTDVQRDEIRQEFVAVLQDQVDPSTAFSSDRRLLCAQTVFGLMDHMSTWLRSKRMEKARNPKQRRELASTDDSLVNVESVIASIPQDLMAQAAMECRAFARSLLNFEQRIRSMKANGQPESDVQVYYDLVHGIYAQLNEPDGMKGITACINVPSIEHRIREHESTGVWLYAQALWASEIKTNPSEPANYVGLLRCVRNLGHYDTLLEKTEKILSAHAQWRDVLSPFLIESHLISGDWDQLEQALAQPGQRSPQHAIAEAVLAMTGRSSEAFPAVLGDARRRLGKTILATGRSPYSQVYDSVLQLHFLHEASLIQDAATRLRSGNGVDLRGLFQTLASRLTSTLPSYHVEDHLLSARRSAFVACQEPTARISIYKDEVAETWISSCKSARKAGKQQAAYIAMIEAERCQAPLAFVQQAKLARDSGEYESAIKTLTTGLQSMSGLQQAAFGNGTSANDSIDLTTAGEGSTVEAIGKVTLLRARMYEISGRFTQNEVIEQYKASTKYGSEKAYYYVGRYYDSLQEADVVNAMSMKHQVCRYFLRSAQAGTKFFYRTVPRLLTIWFDGGDDRPLIDSSSRKIKLDRRKDPELFEKAQHFARICDAVDRSITRLQPYQWLAVFPQLVSRLVHQHERVWEILRDIIALLIAKYPQQAMWGMVAGFHSTDSARKRRAIAVVEQAKAGGNADKDVLKTIDNSQRLAAELLDLCDAPVGKNVTTLILPERFPKLNALAGCGLMLPLQSSVTVNLPPNHSPDSSHRPFPPNLPLIHSFEPTIDIMVSLQKPRKIVILGSDGKRYAFLCKPKDDLRKDARLMEFDSMINKLLQSNSEARKRRSLYVRTYSVVILNEECGLIEWVPNTIGFRHILSKLYQTRGIPIYTGDMQQISENCRAEPKKAGEIFEKQILSRYPPVFHEWFLDTFPEPAAWLKARLAYARTAAVMSMVGFVLGLGDRHGENILFDSVSGDTVHVDLNCLFEKGQTFSVPELVPFRLTRNMTDAMGVTGYEGVFRRAAELTMGILRSNKDVLMSVLEAMIHDPLVEWGTPTGKKASGKPDPLLEAARKSLDPVGKKLDGQVRTSLNSPEWRAPLSTDRLVDELLKEATR